MFKLDYTIESPEQRNEIVHKIIQENPNLTPYYLEILASYLVTCMEKQEKKEKKILTDNRQVTIKKRECSLESITEKMEQQPDAIYNLAHSDRNMILSPAISITANDVKNIPFLKQLRIAIEELEQQRIGKVGRAAYVYKQNIIDLRKDQYIIKQAYNPPVRKSTMPVTKWGKKLPSEILYKDGAIFTWGISLLDYEVCRFVAQNYSKLKEQCWGDFQSDLWYLMEDFDNISKAALAAHPNYDKIMEMKIDQKSNAAIQDELKTYTIEYISTLWCTTIPKLIAKEAQKQWLEWYFTTVEEGKWKKCSRCGQTKLIHPFFFSKNKSSKDGFYSICKECRNKKKGK